MNVYEVIKKPLLTEKGSVLANDLNQVFFEVAMEADKVEIKKAIETLFKVKVEKVRTLVVHGKTKRVGRSVGLESNWKKAIVQLKEGQKLELFEGV